jgi:hypothetical protein
MRTLFGLFFICLLSHGGIAQFLDEFLEPSIEKWRFFTGDGDAKMDFVQSDGYATIIVDATRDKRNIWWALIQRPVSEYLDLSLLQKPEYELRIEARIRVSHAPRRVNLHAHTQKTTDFHTHLMEFDIPVTVHWHTISMTTQNFDAEPGDTVNAQLALMDWGQAVYLVDIDYFKVDVINTTVADPDKGEQVLYPPPRLYPDMFRYKIPVLQDAMIDLIYPEVNFKNWYAHDKNERIPVLTVSETQYVILRWDLDAFKGKRISGPGLLELTTHSLQRAETDLHEFGKIRIVEILGGDPRWERESVTLKSLLGGQPVEEVFNTQMVVDVDVSEEPASITGITIPRPVLQRMADGKTYGLAIRSLGAINAAFYAKDFSHATRGAILYLNSDN